MAKRFKRTLLYIQDLPVEFSIEFPAKFRTWVSIFNRSLHTAIISKTRTQNVLVVKMATRRSIKLRRSPVLVYLYIASKIFEKMTRKPNNWLKGQKFPEDGRTDKNVKAPLRMHLQSF